MGILGFGDLGFGGFGIGKCWVWGILGFRDFEILGCGISGFAYFRKNQAGEARGTKGGGMIPRGTKGDFTLGQATDSIGDK